MGIHHSEHDLKQLGRSFTKEQLKIVFESWVNEHQKWVELSESSAKHYMEIGTWGDEFYHHEIRLVDVDNREIHAIDHSQSTHPIVISHSLPQFGVFLTKDEAVRHYSTKTVPF